MIHWQFPVEHSEEQGEENRRLGSLIVEYMSAHKGGHPEALAAEMCQEDSKPTKNV